MFEFDEKTTSYVLGLVEKARAAQAIYAEFSQEQLNKAARACARVVYDNAEVFAVEAVEETRMGTVEGKIKKMRAAMTSQWHYTKDKISKGVVGWEQGKLDVDCVLKIAKPVGVIGGVMPSTNPTTNIGANALQALKGGNALIVCPHPRAGKVSIHCVDLIREALVAVGAPADLVQCVENPTLELTQAVMHFTDLVLATGGTSMVEAANSSGNPSLGVGQGNCQVIIDKGMQDKFDFLAASAVNNRVWDSGLPCNGEQTIILPACDEGEILAAFDRNGAFVISDPDQVDLIRAALFTMDANGGCTLNRDHVGKSVQDLGKSVGIDVPADKKTLMLKVTKFGKDEPLCREKLCPVSAFFAYEGEWEQAVAIGKANLLMEGAGHSSDIYTKSEEKQVYAGEELPVCRLVVNNGNVILSGEPYFTNGFVCTSGIGCGIWQKNILSENLTFAHLLNYTRMYYTVPGKETPSEEEIWAE